jgi:hypothetical protein
MIALRQTIQRTVDRLVGHPVRLDLINVNSREIYASWSNGHVTMRRSRSWFLFHAIINSTIYAEAAPKTPQIDRSDYASKPNYVRALTPVQPVKRITQPMEAAQ